MSRRLVAAAACACLMAVAGLPARAGEWTRLESDHFVLLTNRDDAIVRDNLKQLERFRWLALKVLNADEKNLRSQAKFDIVLLRGKSALKQVFPGLGDNVGGVYRVCAEGAAAYARHDAFDLAWNLIVLQHEYAHHLMYQYGTVIYPPWYVEGFAEYMSTSSYEDGAVTLGAINPGRLREIRGSMHSNWLPLERLLRWRLGTAKESEDDVGTLYAQAWLLTHYLFSDESRAAKVQVYFDRVAAGEDPVAAFEPATGIALAELDKQLRRYARGDMPMAKVHSADLPQPEVRAVALGDAADAYLMQSLPMMACVDTGREPALLAQLRELARKSEPAPPGLRLELARAEARFGDAAAAIALLDPLVGADPADAEAHYLLGRAWMRQAASLSGAEQAAAHERARSHFFSAYKLRKNHAPTLYHLALALSRDGANPNALNAARAARQLSPAVGEYAVLEARLDLQAGDRERAMRALAPLASNPHNVEAAARMRQAIEAIRAGKSLDDVGALMKPPSRQPAP